MISEYPKGAIPLDPDELLGLKHRHVKTRGELHHLEQATIQSDPQCVLRARNADPLEEIYLRRLHQKMLGEVWKWAGQYCRTERKIGVDPAQMGI